MTNETHVTGEPKLLERRLSTSLSTKMIPAAWQTPLSPRIETAEDSDPAEAATSIPGQPLTRLRLNKLSRQTKIIATLGPSTEDGEVLRKLLQVGASVFRLDAADTGREPALKAVYALRSISTEFRQPVSLLFDAGTVAVNSEEYWAKLRFGIECGADWFAVSANAGTDGLRSLRQFLAEQKRNSIGIMARIDGRTDMDRLGPILAAADGVLVSPSHPESGASDCCQAMAQQCRTARKPAVLTTCTETTDDAKGGLGDVASLVRVQPDALLLVEETSVGRHPVQSVQQLDGLIRSAESAARDETRPAISLTSGRDEAIAATVREADETNAEAIVVFTQSGNSAALCAALRPRSARVFAFTPDTRLARRLILHSAIEPQVLSFANQSNKTIRAAEKLLLERKLLAVGARIVVVTETFVEDQRVSSVQARTLEKA